MLAVWLIIVIGFGLLIYTGTQLATGQIARVARQAGFEGEDLVIAVAIAFAESGGNPDAVGDKNLAPKNGPSIGLWQINIGDYAHPEYKREDLLDPQANANAAYKIYEAAGYKFTPWSTAIGSSPRYLAFLASANREISA